MARIEPQEGDKAVDAPRNYSLAACKKCQQRGSPRRGVLELYELLKSFPTAIYATAGGSLSLAYFLRPRHWQWLAKWIQN